MSKRGIWGRIELDALSAEDREGLRFRVRTTDFAYRDRLIAVCGSCRKATILHPSGLRKRFGNERLSWLEPKLKCEACGNRKGNRFFWAETGE